MGPFCNFPVEAPRSKWCRSAGTFGPSTSYCCKIFKNERYQDRNVECENIFPGWSTGKPETGDAGHWHPWSMRNKMDWKWKVQFWWHCHALFRRRNSNSVGIIMKKEFAKSIIGCWTMSDRVVVIKVKGTLILNIIEAYAPTSTLSELDLETFYHHLDKAMSIYKTSEIKIVMGDFNAKAGGGRQNQTVGPHGLGTRKKNSS